ncbi:MAG TPA: YlxR family protein [Polyangiaceae bacterium]|nr:YlxR family protein [Polyangiaceae bacterium]
MHTTRRRRPARSATRTCVGCGARDDAAQMARLVAVGGEAVAFDGLRPAPGRGAHVHARAQCIARAPRGLARALRRPIRVDAPSLARALLATSERAMVELLAAARRTRLVTTASEQAPLVIVAVDAGPISGDLMRAVSSGRAVAWKTKRELGALLGEEAVAFCSVRHGGMASRLMRWRAAADAALPLANATREGAECSRCPEAR